VPLVFSSQIFKNLSFKKNCSQGQFSAIILEKIAPQAKLFSKQLNPFLPMGSCSLGEVVPLGNMIKGYFKQESMDQKPRDQFKPN
jgi:hypothetical protein